MAEVAEIVYRFLERHRADAMPGLTVGSVDWGAEGRHTTGTYGDLMGLAGRDLAKHFR